jgi:hypothetical protein
MLRRLAFAALALSQVASTAPPPAQPEPPIVIEGRVKQAVQHFVDLLTQSGPTDQIARWKDAICPIVIGIDPAEADFMARRIAEIGKPLRLRAAGSSCTATMAIIFAPDAAGVARELLRRYPITLRTDGYSRLKRFTQSTSPVRWISVTDECGAGCSLPNSRILRATRPTFAAMIVIVDARQIAGFSIGELSDYVALVALSNPPDTRESSRSILSMFSSPRPAGSYFQLTDYDRSFLAGLYGSPLDSGAQGQRSAIVSRMRKELKPKPKPAEGEAHSN